MFKNLSFSAPTVSRQYKRLTTVAERTRANASQRATYNNTINQLNKLQKYKYHRTNVLTKENRFDSPETQSMHLYSCAYYNNDSKINTFNNNTCSNFRSNNNTESVNNDNNDVRSGRQKRQVLYDDIDAQCGESRIQMWFNELVHSALLKYGPPLPAEFAASNHIVSSSYTPWHEENKLYGSNANTNTRISEKNRKTYTLYFHGGIIRRVSANTLHSKEQTRGTKMQKNNDDRGADGKTFVFYDEVPLKTHELYSIIKKLKPNFNLVEDCDNVPFALLIKNCPYFRVFGGKIRYTRYLYRTSHATLQQHDGYNHDNLDDDNKSNTNSSKGSIEVSIAKYKMREVPSFDNIRQGPQPWLFRRC